MVPIIAGVMLAARVPDAQAALAAVRRRLGRPATVAAPPVAPPDRPPAGGPLTYADQRNSSASRHRQFPAAARRGPPASVAGDWLGKGPAVTDDQSTGAAPGPDSTATTRIPRPSADDFAPDVPADDFEPRRARAGDGGVRRAGQRHGADARLRPAARRLRRRSHPRADRASTRRANLRSSPPPPMTTSTSSPARPSPADATGCWSSTAARPACSSGRRSTPRWTARWR